MIGFLMKGGLYVIDEIIAAKFPFIARNVRLFRDFALQGSVFNGPDLTNRPDGYG